MDVRIKEIIEEIDKKQKKVNSLQNNKKYIADETVDCELMFINDKGCVNCVSLTDTEKQEVTKRLTKELVNEVEVMLYLSVELRTIIYTMYAELKKRKGVIK